MRVGQRSVAHPVDVATGALFSMHQDISIPGKIDLIWERRYSTALLNGPPGSLGRGWTTCYFATLTRHESQYHFHEPEGSLDVFDDPHDAVVRGGVVRNLGTFQELTKSGDCYVVTRWDVDTGKVTRYIFRDGKPGESWPLVSIEDPTGQALDLLYGDGKRLVGIRQRLEGRTLTIDYNANERIEAVVLLLPDIQRRVLVRYEYGTDDKLTAAYDALNHADRYDYDARSLMTREIVKDGAVFYFKYDQNGRCIKTSGLDRYDEKSLRFLDSIHWTEVTDSLGNVTRFQWNRQGQVVKEINPLGAIRQTEYDEYGRLIAKIEPNDAVTRYEYDGSGNRCRTIDPLGHIFETAYSHTHLPLTQVDPSGALWEREYDQFNRLVATVDPLGNRWKFAYDDGGNPIEVTAPTGQRKLRVFSQSGLLLEATDWEGNRTRYVYDDSGQLLRIEGPTGQTRRMHYDVMGNMVKIEFGQGLSVTYAYDVYGNLTGVTDANGHTTRYRYGTCRRLLERIDALGNTVKYRWGSEPKRLDEIIDGQGKSWKLTYDEAGRLIHQNLADGREISFIYDVAGKCIAKLDGQGKGVSYKRDLLGRVIEQSLPDGAVTTFEYDSLGNLVIARNADCELKYERDVLGRITREYQGQYVLEWRYGVTGSLEEIRTSLGHEISYKCDANGLVSRITHNGEECVRFQRDPCGRETVRMLPGRARLEQKYDALGRVADQSVVVSLVQSAEPFQLIAHRNTATRSGYPIIHRSYIFDNNSALLASEEIDGRQVEYRYDPAGHLIQLRSGAGETEAFAYDSAGNITTIARSNGEHQQLEYGPGDQLMRCGKTHYSYDENGRLIKKMEMSNGGSPREWLFSWDANDRLRSMITPEAVVCHYQYDPFGRRISKEVAGKVTRFVWDGDVVIHEIGEQGRDATWIFDPHSFKPLCKLEHGQVYSVIHDRLGTPRELLDGFGKVAWAARYSAWGEAQASAVSKVDCPIRFQGQWYDQESGLHYNRFRYYDPANGRFVSTDPLGLLGGLNPYTYARNPINWLDPLGLAESDDGALFRGTSQGYPGSEGLQRIGITPATTDPAIATLYATESENHGPGVVHIASKSDLAGVEIGEGNVLKGMDREVGVGVPPAEFAQRAGTTITAAEAREILGEMGISSPTRIYDKAQLADAIRNAPGLTPEQKEEFIRRAKEKEKEREGCT